jgi:membrane-associated phospholipid phosphatase
MCLSKSRFSALTVVVFAFAFVIGFAPDLRADEVTDWNETTLRAGVIDRTSALNMGRVLAIVQAAVFDAVNGLDKRYERILPVSYVLPAAPEGGSRRAAIAQAAYTTLVSLFPAQKVLFDARLAVAMADINARETSGVAAGAAWGQAVAEKILAWRATDGFTPAPPPFLGSTAVGMWRQTPNDPSPGISTPGVGVQFSYMTPWTFQHSFDFRPAGPPALTSAQYTADFNETKSKGSYSSTTRTTDETISSWLWAAGTVGYLWNKAALSLLDGNQSERERDEAEDNTDRRRKRSLLENAHLFAVLNLAMADSAIACWDAKYFYTFWRPITAIRLADTDGNPLTTADPGWMPLFATPAHPEYPSGHSCNSGAAATVLANEFGEKSHFTVESDVMLGVTRSFHSFSAALAEVINARVYAGIHFRTACVVGQQLGRNVANHVMTYAMQPLNGGH